MDFPEQLISNIQSFCPYKFPLFSMSHSLFWFLERKNIWSLSLAWLMERKKEMHILPR